MELIADRFVVHDDGCAIDLSTGDRVELMVSTCGGPSEQARWAARCDRLLMLHHRSIARLLDYGALGEVRRFEAWDARDVWQGSTVEGERSVSRALAFFHGMAWTEGRCTAIRSRRGRAVIVPDAEAGYEIDAGPNASHAGMPLDVLGLRTIQRSAVTKLAEVLHDARRPDSRALALCGPPESGVATALGTLARVARLQGFVPLAGHVVDPATLEVVRGRSIVSLVREGQADGWRRFLSIVVSSAKPQLILFAGETAPPTAWTVPLEPLTDEALLQSVLPASAPSVLRTQLVAAARRAKGLPGRFAMLLWGLHDLREPARHRRGPIAAELTPSYGKEPASEHAPIALLDSSAWAAAGELAVLRKRVKSGIQELDLGRHAAGNRTLRQAAGFLMRREDWTHALHAWLALAESTIRRGRIREARTLLETARGAAVRARHDEGLARIAVLSGIAATDDARLDDAEAILSGALAAASGLKSLAIQREATLALARCLFWRGQFDRAEALLARADAEADASIDAIPFAALRARVAVGRGDLKLAISLAVTALSRVGSGAPSRLVASAGHAAAFAHLAIGDWPSVEAKVTLAIGAARAAHDPLLGLRARLLQAESLRRQGQSRPALLLIGRVRRMVNSLPAIVRARAELLASVVEDPTSEARSRQVAASGLRALALYAPAPAPRDGLVTAVNDIVDILSCCQTAEDDARVLGNLCARLRGRLRAAVVAFFVDERGTPVMAASDGGRMDHVTATRVAGMDQPLGPDAADDRLEAGAPVRYGGRPIGVIAARWTAGSQCDGKEAVVLLTTAAVAAAPALAGFSVRRHTPANAGLLDLLGTSDAIAEVRRAIERAAPAPFAVLVEGESGSGKELVARALHRLSSRRDRPFCTLNCAALPDDLVESELFGHARGAFTGAVAERPGVFEEAHMGTLFLDEIGELSPRAQAKVLRTVQEGEVRRVGENVSRRVDVRLVTATNRNLRQEAAAGRFRLDLLYRLDVIRIALPPLRDRRDDIALLAEHFWRDATARIGSRATLGLTTLAQLARYDWPGNVREMQNVLAALAVRTPRRGVVPPTALPPQFGGGQVDGSLRLDQARKTFEGRFIRAALARSGGHRSRAAEELGLTRQGLAKLMDRLNISDEPRPVHD